MNYRDIDLYCLTGTPRTENGLMKARLVPYSVSVAKFVSHLRRNRPVTAAADEGAVTVWWDPTARVWRGERHRSMATIESVEFEKVSFDLRKWLRGALDVIRGVETEAATKTSIPIDDVKPLAAAMAAIADTDDWQGVAKAMVAAHRLLELHPELRP